MNRELPVLNAVRRSERRSALNYGHTIMDNQFMAIITDEPVSASYFLCLNAAVIDYRRLAFDYHRLGAGYHQ